MFRFLSFVVWFFIRSRSIRLPFRPGRFAVRALSRVAWSWWPSRSAWPVWLVAAAALALVLWVAWWLPGVVALAVLGGWLRSRLRF
jgi:hypothetical protein